MNESKIQGLYNELINKLERAASMTRDEAKAIHYRYVTSRSADDQ